jgi:hypothetical protein
MPVTTMINGATIATHMMADGASFGIAKSVAGQTAFFSCPGIEADCDTEPIDASDFQRSSIYKKFLIYLAIDARRIYRSHFGFPNLYIPFVTTNAARRRVENDPVQDLPGTDLVRETTASLGAYADRELAAGRTFPVQFSAS